MKCPFELPVEKKYIVQVIEESAFHILDAYQNTICKGLTEETADYIVQAINSHEKLVEELKEARQLIHDIALEARQLIHVENNNG